MMLGLANGINGPSMIDIGNIYQSSISVISKVIAFGSGGGLVGGFLGVNSQRWPSWLWWLAILLAGQRWELLK